MTKVISKLSKSVGVIRDALETLGVHQIILTRLGFGELLHYVGRDDPELFSGQFDSGAFASGERVLWGGH